MPQVKPFQKYDVFYIFLTEWNVIIKFSMLFNQNLLYLSEKQKIGGNTKEIKGFTNKCKTLIKPISSSGTSFNNNNTKYIYLNLFTLSLNSVMYKDGRQFEVENDDAVVVVCRKVLRW